MCPLLSTEATEKYRPYKKTFLFHNRVVDRQLWQTYIIVIAILKTIKLEQSK